MENNIDKMIFISKEKKELLDTILDLTNKQKEAIEKNDLENLGLILEDKEKLMGKIDSMDIEFLKVYNFLKEKEGIETFNEIDIEKYNNLKCLKDIVSDINNVLRGISNQDKENTKTMKLSINNIKQDIKNVKKGKKAYNGYNYENADSMLIDEKK